MIREQLRVQRLERLQKRLREKVGPVSIRLVLRDYATGRESHPQTIGFESDRVDRVQFGNEFSRFGLELETRRHRA